MVLRNSSTLSVTLAPDGDGWSASCTDHFTPRRDLASIVQETGWAPGQVWTGAEDVACTGTRTPDRPAHRESLYWPTVLQGLALSQAFQVDSIAGMTVVIFGHCRICFSFLH